MAAMVVDHDGIFIRSGLFSRRWKLGRHGAVTRSLRVADWSIPLISPDPAIPECYYDGLLRLFMHRAQPDYPDLRLQTIEGPVTGRGPVFEGEHQRLTAVWEEPVQGTLLGRSWRVYPGADAIATLAEIGSASAPQLEFGRSDYLNVVETLPIDMTGWNVCAVGLWGRTDNNNDLVRHERRGIEKAGSIILLHGNLLFLEPPGGGRGLFILVESPPEDEKRPETPAAFRIGPEGVQVLGWGLAPSEILPARRRQSYTVAVGGYIGGEPARLRALRTFLKARYPASSHLQTIVANPWGDRKCYEHLSETFILKELDACAELGITHYQVDDGWQAGGTLADFSIRNAARPASFWDIHPDKFPRGFAPLSERGAALGVRLALWFAPDANRHYRNWREEGDILLDLHRRYGIELFKIDAVWLRTREAEENLTALLENVHRASAGRVQFNLDATAGRRQGHIAMLRYGNVFLENRYVRQAGFHQANTYIPWRVLRNLWNISRYLPPERIQLEVPNCHQACFRSPAEIAAALDMNTCRDDYLAAQTIIASPLFWGEPSGLPAAARADIGRIMQLHRDISAELAGSQTFPVGEEPGGRQWTGFQTVKPACVPTPGGRDSGEGRPGAADGLLLVFREDTTSDCFEFDLPYGPDDRLLAWECLSHPETPVPAVSARRVVIHIPRPNDFRLYRYRPAG